jgi:hypothetical protein
LAARFLREKKARNVHCTTDTGRLPATNELEFCALMADKEAEPVHSVDQAIYQSHSPRVAALGMRYGHGRCTVLWIKDGEEKNSRPCWTTYEKSCKEPGAVRST